MTKKEKLKIYQDVKKEINTLRNGGCVCFGRVGGHPHDYDVVVERDDMVEFQPTYIVNDYIMSNRAEIIGLICREIL